MSDRSALMTPLRRVVLQTPADGTTFEATRAIMIETTGPVAVLMKDDTSSVVIAGLLGGVWHPLQITKVLDTGTTATTVYLGY